MIVEVGKVIVEVGKMIVEVGKVILEVGKVIVEVGKVFKLENIEIHEMYFLGKYIVRALEKKFASKGVHLLK